MKKFIIKCDTHWCGTDSYYRALAESENNLYELAEELAHNNFYTFADTSEVLEELGYDMDDLSENEIEDIIINVDDSDFYSFQIEECCDDEEWDSFGDEYIYIINTIDDE